MIFLYSLYYFLSVLICCTMHLETQPSCLSKTLLHRQTTISFSICSLITTISPSIFISSADLDSTSVWEWVWFILLCLDYFTKYLFLQIQSYYHQWHNSPLLKGSILSSCAHISFLYQHICWDICQIPTYTFLQLWEWSYPSEYIATKSLLGAYGSFIFKHLNSFPEMSRIIYTLTKNV